MKIDKSKLEYFGRMIFKDPRLIWSNIRERLIFDWTHGVDTVRQVPKDEYVSSLLNVQYGLHYSSSWTSEIIFGFRSSIRHLDVRFASFQFMDIGCGKGKVQIVWEQLLRKQQLIQNTFGLDYFEEILLVARRNHEKLFGSPGAFLQADASQFDFRPFGSLILYLYNPFGEVVLRPMIDNLRYNEVFLIYNNPVHEDVLLDAGFCMIERKDGFHPQAVTRTYYRNAINA